LDILDGQVHIQHIHDRAGPLQGNAILLGGSRVQIVLDDHAPSGKQQGNALSIGLKQTGQIGLDLFQVGTGLDLPGKGNLVTAHGHTPVKMTR